MKRLKPELEQLGSFCRGLGNMYHAGICAGDALALMAEDEGSPAEKALLQKMSRMADEGLPLAQIFREADCFPEYMCSLMLVGEKLGRSEDTLFALADYYDGRAELERQVKNTLLYPSVLLLVLLAVVFVLLVWIMPVFNDVYARLGSGLSGLAGGLLQLGFVLKKALPVLAVLLAALLCCILVAAVNSDLRHKLLGVWRRRFGDRGIGRRVNSARFVQALAMGLAAGLTEREALDLAANLAQGSESFARRSGLCAEKLDGGACLGSALRESGMISGAESRLLETGFRSGRGAQVMEQISRKALENSRHELESMAGRAEPALVIIMSLVVGLILLSVMLPLMNIMSAIG